MTAPDLLSVLSRNYHLDEPEVAYQAKATPEETREALWGLEARGLVEQRSSWRLTPAGEAAR